jgi:2-keto-4-pentenoate hydratase/2-oxohepta-3-ene-1,7-dioic acid hydratase in catechol pathway
MKLVTFDSRARPARVGALLPDGAVLDLSSASGEAPAVASMLALIEAGEEAWAHARGLVADARREHVHGTGAYTLRAPLPLPAQFRDSMCFHKHIEQSFKSTMKLRAQASGDPEQVKAAEAAAAAFTVPEIYERQPVWYKGNRFNVADPGEDIPWPPFSALADFELELACVIGRRGRDLEPATALDHVFGFTIFNDFTARDIQSAEMQGMLGPAKGKDFDKANVFGPCIVTTDEIGDPNDLKMTAWVNGEVWCEGHSGAMHWSFGQLLAWISRGETLHPGEVIASGTVGDGCGLEHLRFLKSGDVVELEIEKIGRLSNRVVMAQP